MYDVKDLEIIVRPFHSSSSSQQEGIGHSLLFFFLQMNYVNNNIKTKTEQTNYLLPHPIWKGEYVDGTKITHRPPATLIDKVRFTNTF